MLAIVNIIGKQFSVTKDQKITVDNLNQEEGSEITFDKVLCIKKDDDSSIIGQPLVEGANVKAKITKNFKDKKILIFKKRRRQNSRRKRGHRQHKTEIQILSINT